MSIKQRMERQRDQASREGYAGAAERWQKWIDDLPWVSHEAARALKNHRTGNPMKKRRSRSRKSHTGARTKAKRITAQIRKLKQQRRKLYR